MRRLFGAAAVVVLLSLVLAAGCTSPQPQVGYVTIRSMDISIPDGQPPSNVTTVVVIPYLDAVYADVGSIDLQVSAKEAGTDIVVAETVLPIGNLTPGKTIKEEVSLVLENSRRYDIWVKVWQGGRMRESGSVNVYLPDRTVIERRLAYSLLSVTALDVMTPDLAADPITLDIVTTITNGGRASSGDLAMDVRVVNLQTGITAVRESRPLGTITGERAAEKQVRVTVPNGYDYEISIRLVEGGAAFATSTGRITLAPPPQVVLAGGQSGVVLDSTRSKSPVSLPVPTAAPTAPSSAQVGQFKVQSGGAPTPTQAPGFPVALAAVALLGAGAAVCGTEEVGVATEGLTAWRGYLYAVSFVALIVAIIGSVNLIAVAIEVFVYPAPQPYPVPQYYPALPGSVAQVVVGLIVWAYHWRLLQKEH